MGFDVASGSQPDGTRIWSRATRFKLFLLLLAALVLGLLFVLARGAGAVTTEEELARFGSHGTGAGQLHIPRGVATDSSSGAVYVADGENNRISRFGPWGEFIESWGWGVSNGAAEFQKCTTTCQKGVNGGGSGQFSGVGGVAVDGAGNVYTYEGANHRVQKFSASGAFILMIGGGVNKTTGEDLCTAASGDECGPGVVGTGPGEFTTEFGHGHIAIDSANRLLFGDKERLQIFESSGAFASEVSLPGRNIAGIAYDGSSNSIYTIYVGQANVEKLSLTGELLDTLDVAEPEAVTVDPSGIVYVIDNAVQGGDPSKEHPQRVLQFDPAGEFVSSCCDAEPAPLEPAFEVFLRYLATNAVGDLYVTAARGNEASYVTAYGPPPLLYGPPPAVAPTIASQFVASARADGANVRAAINPFFWQDATYYVEYGTGVCSEGGCPEKQPVPSALLTSKAVKKPITTDVIPLSGLEPSTQYHFRFVSESSGGGPVYGIDPDGEGPEEATFEDGLEGTLETFPTEGAGPSCANVAFRQGAAAFLPDCRAYEMVSPINKENGDIAALIDVTGYETHLNQSSLDGEALTFSSYRSFGGSEGAPYTVQYMAKRSAGGWGTESLTEPRGPGSFYGTRLSGENEFKAFTPDLCKAWFVKEAEPQLAPGAVEGFPNVYRRDNCPKAYEALTTVAPPNVAPENYVPEPQGYSADGSKAIFRAEDNLTPDAPTQSLKCVEDGEECLSRLYEVSAGGLKLVCILPNGTPNPGNCSAGSPPTAAETSFNRTASVRHAISEDGSRIYWSASAGVREPGKIFLRLNGTSTVKVSETQSTLKSRFWGASADGGKALFTVTEGAKADNLYLYSLAGESSTLIAGKVIGVAGMSENLSHVYFVSENSIGGEGSAGKPNLYLSEEGTTTFIATLSSTDVRLTLGGRIPSNVSFEPVYHAAQASPDGERLAFISTNPLTGFDNTDAISGKPDSEVFTYAADTDTLNCVSCSPVGASPAGRNVQAQANEGFLWTAAYIPTGQNQLYTPRVISEDNKRVFFTSFTDLLPRDENGKADVYEWELPGTSESCEGEDDPDYYPANGACLFLISSGQSPQDSEFVDSSPSGRDVFFGTQESLVSQDPDLLDIYDARIEGGFPPVPPPKPICEGEGCQDPPPPPATGTPPSEGTYPGNPPQKKPIKCPKGKHRVVSKNGKERCVKNKPKKHKGKNNNKGKKRANNNGRAGR